MMRLRMRQRRTDTDAARELAQWEVIDLQALSTYDEILKNIAAPNYR